MKAPILALALLGACTLSADPSNAANPTIANVISKQQHIEDVRRSELESWLKKMGEQNYYKLESLIELGISSLVIAMLKYYPIAAAAAVVVEKAVDASCDGTKDLAKKADPVKPESNVRLQKAFKYFAGTAAFSTIFWALYKLYRDASNDNCLRDKLKKLDDEASFLQQYLTFTKTAVDGEGQAPAA